MSPARVGPGHNPLRDPRDKRLPRIAGPCGLVLFGVTGDLATKKLMPAIYDLANRGLLPPGYQRTFQIPMTPPKACWQMPVRVRSPAAICWPQKASAWKTLVWM